MKNKLALVALLAVNIIYAINYLVVKGVSPDYIGPSGFIFLRASFAMILFWMVGQFIPSEKIEKKDWIRIVLGGAFGVAINQLLFFEGIVKTTSVNASIIMTSNPIFVLIVASILIGEKLNARKFLGIGLGLVGAFTLISMQESTKTAADPFMGNLMVLANALSYGMYLVIIKPIMSKYQPLTVIKWVFTFGFIFVVPFGISEFRAIDWNLPIDIWMNVGFVLIFTTFLAYFLNIYALQKVPASVVSSFIYLQPIITAIIAYSLGLEKMDAIKIISGISIFIGVYLVTFSAKKPPENAIK
jgi:drug/metabolite transporter (DMT)-like permease